MEWISVKDKRPKLGEEVLCYYRCVRIDGTIFEDYRVLYYLIDIRDKRERIFSDRNVAFGDMLWGDTPYPVTHWTYLDRPMEEDK